MPDRLTRLYRAVDGASRVLILTHNDPDPDAIASAVALRTLLEERIGVECAIAYRGMVGRAENKALVRYLDRPLRRLTSGDWEGSPAVALVDSQPGTGNNPLPPGAPVAIVLDHHPRQKATRAAAFAVVRPQVGAVSTLLTELLQAAGLEPGPRLATALFYGIKTDTLGLARDASPADVRAYFYLQPRIEVQALAEIERAQVPAGYFQRLEATLRATRVYGRVVIAYAGPMPQPDLAAEMADLLTRLRGARWVVCMGVYEEELVLSIRTTSRRGGAGLLAQAIVGGQGTAGGHGTMAAGHVPLRGRAPEALARQLTARTLAALRVPPKTPAVPLMRG